MFEKVNPCHPDNVADRIAGALVDLAYTKEDNPKIAVEVLIGHGVCTVTSETSVHFEVEEVYDIVKRITKLDNLIVKYQEVKQDEHLANNQVGDIRCGDNGIFKGTTITDEQILLTEITEKIYDRFGTDGKYIIDGDKLIICQSNATKEEIKEVIKDYDFREVIINPLGEWTGGTDVDTGATNRKLGSDMGDSVTGGGIHSKDLSKADVSLNIYAFLLANLTNEEVKLCCAIGDEFVNGMKYSVIVDVARQYIKSIGGFEKFAEYGLISPQTIKFLNLEE